MKSENRTRKTISLPDNLSYQAAMALYDVLCELSETVWEHYHSNRYSNRQRPFPLTRNPDDFDDEAPS